MKILRIETVEDCLDDVTIKGIYFDAPLDEKDVMTLCRMGKSQYYQHFSRPFFRVSTSDGAQIKGIQGDCSIQVMLKQRDEPSIQALCAKIENELSHLDDV